MSGHPGAVATSGAQVCCDLCGYAMPLPEPCITAGEILGLLVCTQCVEDNLETAFEPRAEVGLVGTGAR